MIRRIFIGLAWYAFAVSAFGGAAEPSFFRRDSGLLNEKNPLPENLAKDAQLLWRADLAPGNSTPCIVGDSVIVTTYKKETQQLTTVALDSRSGALRWEHVVPATEIEPHHPVGSPASCTPASSGDKVFVFFGSYGLLCYDLDGNIVWEKRMGPFQDEFGASSSPVIVDDLVVMNQDHDIGSFLIGIDQATGETVWKTPRPNATRSYSTPVIWDSGEGKQVIVAGSLRLTAYDSKTGERLWWINGLSRIVDSTPIVADGGLFVATWTPGGDSTDRIAMEPFAEALSKMDANEDGRIEISELPDGSPVAPRFFRMDLNQDRKLDKSEWGKHASVFTRAQNVAIRIKPGGKGDVTDSNVEWVYRRGLPTVPSSVVYGGILYMVKDSGIITSLDAETGELLKRGRAAGPGNYYCSIVAGDGKVYLCSERGVLTVLKAGRNWDVVSSHDFGERMMATPVVSGGRLFVRTDEAMYCFKKK